MEFLKNISILGDSISKGIVLDKISLRYKILKESAADLFGRENNIKINNLARFGLTSEKALAMTDKLSRIKADEEGIVLLELGGNDCDFDWDAVAENPNIIHKANVSLEDFRKNISKLIDIIRDYKQKVAIVTLPPIDSEKYFNWISKGDADRASKLMIFLKDKSYIYRHQELYASVLEEVANIKNVFKIPVRSHLLSISNYNDYLCDDGIHLTSAGQKAMNQVYNNTYHNFLNARAPL